MGSLKTDDSFTSLVLGDGHKTTGYVIGLTDPTRYLRHEPLSTFIQSHGALATRFWLMVACNVGVLYSTNPSTLAVFLADVGSDWDTARALIRDFIKGGEDVQPLHDLLKRVASRGHHARMTRIANAQAPLPVTECLPALHAYCRWDGGGVGTFLERVHRHLPPERVAHIPMYLMSTETVQPLPYSQGEELHVLPIAEGVLYELLPEGSPDDPEALLSPAELEPGEAYSMGVSDPCGLLGYQTEDVLRCVATIEGLPDLRFERRRGLAFSFTGEKLTGEQLSMAFSQPRAEHPTLLEVDMTSLPSRPPEPTLPGHVLVLGYPTGHRLADVDEEAITTVTRTSGALLCTINQGLASK